jgi:glycosyltransferase involved in cell wall biosynthesis
LFVSRQSGLGGTERRLTDLQKNLVEKGYTVLVFSSVKVSKNKIINKLNNNYIVRLARLLVTALVFKPDIIHCFDLESGIYSFFVRKFFLRRAKLISGYGAEKILDPRTQKILKNKKFLADLFICNSTKAVADLERFIGKERKILLIRNGLDESRLEGNRKEKKLIKELSKNSFLIGYIGKLDNIKHGERILDIAKILYEKYPKTPFRYLIIGDGPNRHKLINELNEVENDLKEKFTVMGSIPDAGILSKFFNIGVLCSDSEGFPNVLLEYMYFGVPWISTDVGDVREIERYGIAGIIVENWDASIFANECYKLYQDRSLYLNLSATGKKIFKNNYTSDKMAAEHVKEYKKIINGKYAFGQELF